ncbi:MAG: aspartate aminotransferase family protein [Gemmatimonadales bacterium]|nr:aspartate aminotransferase family protein [Gemmatimonadales bacterium]MYG48988.1 aspartate aminotransferase family protein [Gemmatimonadales bacterium]MYK01852.1 aspartate aminotransferase family protein [Candidatus Palauibacter ramosifaciens]
MAQATSTESPEVRTRKRLPERGIEWETLRGELLDRKAIDYDWRNGRVPYLVYYVNEDVKRVQDASHATYSVENALSGQGSFPSVGAMEDEVIQMGLDLFNAPEGAGGQFTSGGTESIFQAVKVARDMKREARPDLGRLNIVAAYSRHPSVDKAAQILDLDMKYVGCRSDWRADVDAIREAIDEASIFIYAGAPTIYYGLIDPMRELGELALETGVRLHSDACYGGFISPFARELGYPVPDFDLSVPGVSSLSADLHKFGFAQKSASLVLFTDGNDLGYARYVVRDLAGGTYASATAQGSRPGGAVACAWTMLQHLGREGYREVVRGIMETTRAAIEGVRAIDGLYVFEPEGDTNLFRYDAEPGEPFNIFAVARLMNERGWMMGQHRVPPAIHQPITSVHAPVLDEYLTDLAECVAIARRDRLQDTFLDGTY